MKTNNLDFDAQALREKILDLAMRGKLVEQNPDDEPASVLLEKIKAEKEQLIKEKKIKKSKALPPISDDEKPFEIPDSWEWVRLEEISAPMEYAMADGPFGSNLKKADYTVNPEVRIIQLSNIGEHGWKDENKKYTTFEHLKDIKRSEVYPGNIVIAKMMPAGRAIIVPNKDKKYVLSSDAVKFIPYNLLDTNYLLNAINSNVYLNQVNNKLQGTTRPRTSLKKLRGFVLPLPPLEEQSRIAAKIAQLFALLRKVESSIQQYAKLQTLLKSKVLDLAMRAKLVKQDPNDEPASVLLEKIQAEKAELIEEKKIKKSKLLPPITDDEKPFDIPDSWEWVRLGDISQNIKYGLTASAQSKGNVKFLRITDIQDGVVNWNTVPFCNVSEKDLSKIRLLQNDFLIARTGGTVGKSYFVENIPINSTFASYLIRIRLICPNISDYLKYVLNSNLYWSFISRKKSGTGQPNVNAKKLSEFIFPLPPLNEQKRIIEIIKAIFIIN